MAFSFSTTVTNILNTGRAFILGDDSECDYILDMDDYSNEFILVEREIRGEFQSPRSSHELRTSFQSPNELRGEFQSPRFIKPQPKFIPIVSEINQNEKPNIICPKVIKPLNRPPTITTKLYKTNETILTEEYDDNSFN